MTATKKEWDKEIETIIHYYNGDYERFLQDSICSDGIYDKKIMQEIVDLIKKNTVEDKLQALNILDTPSAKFPNGFDANVLLALKKDKNPQVQERAIALEKERLTKVLSKFSKMSSSFGSLGSVFSQLSFDITAKSTAFDQSQKVAKELAKVIDKPIKSINPKKYLALQEAVGNLEGLNIPFQIDKQNSPITSSLTFISPIVLQPKSNSTIPELLHRSKASVIKDLKRIEKSDRDINFNVEAYRLLYNLERTLRDLIQTRICEKHKKIIKNKIHPDDLIKWKERQSEEKADPLLDGDYRLIEYSDFSDLKRIFEKGKNKEEFHDLLDDEQFRNIISKLDELDSIRKKIAHSRPLTKREFDKLKIYAEDIARLFKK
jgi:hypothetical protein